MATQLSVRKVSGYAITPVMPAVSIRNLSVYSLQTKKRVINFKDKSGLEILLDLINDESISTLELSTLSFSAPQSNEGAPGIVRNTKITVTALPDNIYTGSKQLKYNRINISRPFTNPTVLGFTIPAATTIHALIPSINAAHNVKLLPSDVVDGAIEANAAGVVLKVATSSYLYLPGEYLVLGDALFIPEQWTEIDNQFIALGNSGGWNYPVAQS